MTSTENEVPTHQVALTFEDGVSRFIKVREDQTVADASYRQRINIPLDCRDGACGTCKALCESGDYDGGSYIEDALTADEAAKGYVLPCSMKPKSDLVLQIAGTSQMAKAGASTWKGTVTGIEHLSATTVQLSVEVERRDELVFLPGQYVNIGVPGTDQKRSYSFSNAPGEPVLTFLMRVSPGGVMSTWLTERAAVGDTLEMDGPHGSFFLRETNRPLLLVAGGTGLAPILSIMRQLRDQGVSRPTHLVYGVSGDADVVALDQIEGVAAELPEFSWDFCVSRPDSDQIDGRAVKKGYVMSLIDAEHLHDGEVAIYLCGPPPMVEAVRQDLDERGVEPDGFYFEKFALAVPAAAAKQAAEGLEEAEDQAARDAEVLAAEPQAVATQTAAPRAGEARTGESGRGEAQVLLFAADARNVAKQQVFAPAELEPRPGPAADHGSTLRRIAKQEAFASDGSPASGAPVEAGGELLFVPQARNIAKQQTFPVGNQQPLVASAQADGDPQMVAEDGYQIGEEHPDVQFSDALFDARAALELGALDLTIGRLDATQISGYRLLAEATAKHVDGENLVDPAGFTEANGAFHDYLFGLTGNAHLLQAHQALDVKAHMNEALRDATWIDARCTADHVELVDLIEAGDRDGARALLVAHAERAKQTTRRAMNESRDRSKPRFITPGRFANQVVLVTGSAQGIGAQVARRIAAEGGSLVLADRSPLVQELVVELQGQGAQVVGVECDLEQGAGARQMVEQALERFGRLDVLVNNVGGAINFKPFTEFTDDEIQAEITRSLMTTLYACRAALPVMQRQQSGVVVNVSSAATRGIHRIPYSAAKGGINAITASLALEYAGDGIRVVGTAPGGTEAPPRRISRGTPEARTEQERAWFQAHIDQTLEHSLMGRYGTLDEQAAAICFLASPEASYITGSVLPVAGGDLG
ncbi:MULTISPECIES: benzoate 1,2-dioxygenase electron transfer component BenC [unclassified Luteococcus]|uniref:benzoate 1,2-dioxygenase electron transfer component BenC n=1 Tax=unclassified Luteococcus TaxID=2639923 RepID=UPI00313F0293